MSREVDALKAYFAVQGSLETRLKESSKGDVEFFQRGPPEIPGLSLSEKELIGLLLELEEKGAVTRSEKVHSGDSSEYIVTWTISTESSS